MGKQELNSLEEALKLATDDCATRPEFCRVLMQSLVFILADNPNVGQKEQESLGKDVRVEKWQRQDGTLAIPFFSSLEKLKKTVKKKQSYLALPARSLFEMTAGDRLVLNPLSDYSKEFCPEEIKNLLETGVSHELSEQVLDVETDLILSQPEPQPYEMLDSLKKMFREHQGVKRAFIAFAKDQKNEANSQHLLCVDIEGDAEKVYRSVGAVVGDVAPGRMPVSLYRLSDEDSPLNHYFSTNAQPFYERLNS